VGIDLGTTDSLVAHASSRTASPFVCAIKDGRSSLVPSIVHFGEDQSVLVGRDAREKLVTDPARTIFSVKRLMGKSYLDIAAHTQFFGYKIIDDDTESLVKIRVDDKLYTPIELSALILRELKQRVRERTQHHCQQGSYHGSSLFQ
jgi:molecular chaperone HscA